MDNSTTEEETNNPAYQAGQALADSIIVQCEKNAQLELSTLPLFHKGLIEV